MADRIRPSAGPRGALPRHGAERGGLDSTRSSSWGWWARSSPSPLSGSLIDLFELAGLGAMAQVDLGRRIHRNHDDHTLGRMAAQVMLAVLSRLEAHGKAVPVQAPGSALTQFHRVDARDRPVTTDISVTERPPVVTHPEYRRRVGAH